MTPQEQLKEIRSRLVPLYQRQEKVLTEDILPGLEKEGIVIHDIEKLSKEEKKNLKAILLRMRFTGADSAQSRPRTSISAYCQSQLEHRFRAYR
jgi:hypothetical protein